MYISDITKMSLTYTLQPFQLIPLTLQLHIQILISTLTIM